MSEAASTAHQLSNPEKRVLLHLRAKRQCPLEELVAGAGFASETEALGAASWLQAKGLLRIEEAATPVVALDAEGKDYAARGLPEARLHGFVRTRGGAVPLTQVRNQSQLTSDEIQIALAWWKRKGLGELLKQGAETIVQSHATPPPSPDEKVLAALTDGRPRPESELDPKGLALLKARRGVLRASETKRRTLHLTDAGVEVGRLPLALDEEIGQLTPELIRSGAWRQKPIRPYDVATPAPRAVPSKPHPLVQIIEDVRDIFLELGFQEIEDEYVVSTFWDMDALFIPQDHPAREMQDTFYLENPATLPVEPDVIEKIRRVHETGGRTGSRGWGGRFDPAESTHALLRTHTTVGTIRHLARHPEGPLRVFSIGRVFRKETMDATHLPEFHQIEGIATEPGADFRMLLGILKEFYKRIGFEKLRWRPSYYPYTEPSMDVEVWTGSKWLELGGCGIFRPEVTLPFGVKTPVLAWGLGLERLAMMRLGLKDIRELYVSDLEWLRGQPLL